jgi:hypothetical protein
VHAIVGDGHRGVTDDIPYWRRQRRFGSRLGPPLFRLKTPPRRATEAVTAFAEGVDISAAHRIRERSRSLRDLPCGHYCGHLQLDELVARVRQSIERVRVWVWGAVGWTGYFRHPGRKWGC